MFRRASWLRARRMRCPLPSSWQEILETRVAFYRRLPEAERQELVGLTQVLMGEVGFEAAIGLDRLDESMRIIIASQAALCLLHRPLPELPRLRTVIVYPGAYRARERKHTAEGVEIPVVEERHGEAWEHGVMLLSWDDVAYDAECIDDGLNVVLHEMAHVLDAESGEMDGRPLLPDSGIASRWLRVIGESYSRLERQVRLRRNTVLDPYGAEDHGEFYAVATEAFFESPQGLRDEYPGLYSLLQEYYRVDPSVWADRLPPAAP